MLSLHFDVNSHIVFIFDTQFPFALIKTDYMGFLSTFLPTSRHFQSNVKFTAKSILKIGYFIIMVKKTRNIFLPYFFGIIYKQLELTKRNNYNNYN